MKRFIHSFALLGLLLFVCGCVQVATGSSNSQSNSDLPTENSDSVNITKSTNDDVELGRVQWRRDLKAAMKDSKKSGKPIFVQFQEVPG